MRFLDLSYRKINLGFWDKNLKKRRLYYSLNKCNSKKVIIKDKLS